MLTIPEWLDKAGFSGHPFALKEADSEQSLQSYFVEHDAYLQILRDELLPLSGIVHAPRGAGKSTLRHMFVEHQRRRFGDASLIIPLLDWEPIYKNRWDQDFNTAIPHFQQIAIGLLTTLAAGAPPKPLHTSDLRGFLAWLAADLHDYLRSSQRKCIQDMAGIHDDIADFSMQRMTTKQRMEIIAEIVRECGYQHAYILVDRIDELLGTSNDWEVGADMVAPLIANLPLNEIPGLAVRYFLPTEVIEVLRDRRQLRSDRLNTIHVIWDEKHLTDLLANRLIFYSRTGISSLGFVATIDIRDDIDSRLVAAAHGSPRRLLNLGEKLLDICARSSDNDTWQITAAHLENAIRLSEIVSEPPAVLHHIGQLPPQPETPRSAVRLDSSDMSLILEPSHTRDLSLTDVPLLRIDGGIIYKGAQEVPDSVKLPKLQRRLLDYLYQHRDSICEEEKLIQAVWGTNNDPENLRKLVDRLIERLEDDPQAPQYIIRIQGVGWRLRNAV